MDPASGRVLRGQGRPYSHPHCPETQGPFAADKAEVGRWGVPFVQFLLLHTFNLSASPVPPSAPPCVLPLSSLLNLSPFFPEPPSLTNFHCLYHQLSPISFPSFISTSSGLFPATDHRCLSLCTCFWHFHPTTRNLSLLFPFPLQPVSILSPGSPSSPSPLSPRLSLFLSLHLSPSSAPPHSVSLHLWLPLPLHLSCLCHPLSFFYFSSVPPSPYCPSPSLPLYAHPRPTG